MTAKGEWSLCVRVSDRQDMLQRFTYLTASVQKIGTIFMHFVQ